MHSHATKISDIMILKNCAVAHKEELFMPLVSMKEMLIDAKMVMAVGQT